MDAPGDARSGSPVFRGLWRSPHGRRVASACRAGSSGSAALLEETGNAWWPLAAYTAVLCLITVLTTFAAPDDPGRDLLSTAGATSVTGALPATAPAADGRMPGPAGTNDL